MQRQASLATVASSPMQLDPVLEDRIVTAVRERMSAQLAFTMDLVRFPSTRGNEREAQAFVAAALRERGLEVDEWTIDEATIRDHPGFSPGNGDYVNAINIVGTHEPNEAAGKSLILNGHIDVVPPGPLEMWKVSSPFEPRLSEDDRLLYGRGAADMKVCG